MHIYAQVTYRVFEHNGPSDKWCVVKSDHQSFDSLRREIRETGLLGGTRIDTARVPADTHVRQIIRESPLMIGRDAIVVASPILFDLLDQEGRKVCARGSEIGQ